MRNNARMNKDLYAVQSRKVSVKNGVLVFFVRNGSVLLADRKKTHRFYSGFSSMISPRREDSMKKHKVVIEDFAAKIASLESGTQVLPFFLRKRAILDFFNYGEESSHGKVIRTHVFTTDCWLGELVPNRWVLDFKWFTLEEVRSLDMNVTIKIIDQILCGKYSHVVVPCESDMKTNVVPAGLKTITAEELERIE